MYYQNLPKLAASHGTKATTWRGVCCTPRTARRPSADLRGFNRRRLGGSTSRENGNLGRRSGCGTDHVCHRRFVMTMIVTGDRSTVSKVFGDVFFLDYKSLLHVVVFIRILNTNCAAFGLIHSWTTG